MYVFYIVVCAFSFVWPLCCLFFDMRFMITPLVSLNSSFNKIIIVMKTLHTSAGVTPVFGGVRVTNRLIFLSCQLLIVPSVFPNVDLYNI